MKEKILRIFLPILVALVTCTLLSQKIEEEMLLEVIVWFVKEDFMDSDVPGSMLLEDEEGRHLIEVAEGSGWSSGWRANEVLLTQAPGTVQLFADRDYYIARGASRIPANGELAQIYDGNDTAPSTYLCVYPDGVPTFKEDLLMFDILERSENALIVHLEAGALPFMENRAKNAMVQISSHNWRVFDLATLESFLNAIPYAAILLPWVLGIALLTIFSAALPARRRRNRKALILNCILITVLLAGLPVVMQGFDFPSSMMPSRNIFDWHHYRTQMETVFSVLETLPKTGPGLIGLKNQSLTNAFIVLAFGCPLPFVFLLLESMYLSKRKKRRKKYTGKYLAA